MSAAEGGLGRGLAIRVRPRVRIGRRPPGRSGLGAIARRARGFGLAVGRSSTARPRIDRVGPGLGGAPLRPPVVHWRSDLSDEWTAADAGGAGGAAGAGHSGSSSPVTRQRDRTSRSGPAATAAEARPSLGDPKLDALRRLVSNPPPSAPGSTARRSNASGDPTGTTDTLAPLADPNAPEALRRASPAAGGSGAGSAPARRDRDGERSAGGAGRGPADGRVAPGRTTTDDTTSERPAPEPASSPAVDAAARSGALVASAGPGGTVAGPRTGPGQLGRRLRPEIAPAAVRTDTAPIPTAPASTPAAGSSTWNSSIESATSPAPADRRASRPRSDADRIAALRRTVERRQADGANPATTSSPGPRPDPNLPLRQPPGDEPVPRSGPSRRDPSPSPGTTRTTRTPSTPATATPPVRADRPIRPDRRGQVDREGAPRADAGPPGPPTTSSVATAATLVRPLAVLRRSAWSDDQADAEQAPTSPRQLPHSRSLTHRPITSVTAPLHGPTGLDTTASVVAPVGGGEVLPIEPPVDVVTRDASGDRRNGATSETPLTTDGRRNRSGAHVAGPTVATPAIRREAPTPSGSTSDRAPRSSPPRTVQRRTRRRHRAPASSIILARPGTLFSDRGSTRSVVATGPGALAPALRPVERSEQSLPTSTDAAIGSSAPTSDPAPGSVRAPASPPHRHTGTAALPTTLGPGRTVDPEAMTAPTRTTEPAPAPPGRSPVAIPGAIRRNPDRGSGTATPPVDVTSATPAPTIARAPVSDPAAAMRERTDALAERFLSELGRGAPPRPTPLPVAFSPMAEAITGRRRVMISTDEASRRALRAVGRPAATTDDVIHLDRPVHRPDRRSTEIIAHELTHVAHPSPAPRFFDDDHRGPEERQAEQVARIMARAPLAPGSPVVRRSLETRPGTSTEPGTGTATGDGITADQLAARLTGGAPTTIRRSTGNRSSSSSTSSGSSRSSGSSTSSSSSGSSGSGPVIRRLLDGGGSSMGSSSTPGGSNDSGVDDATDLSHLDRNDIGHIVDQLEAVAQTAEGREWFRRLLIDHADVLLRTIEDHVIVELERRGGRNWGRL